MKTCIPLYVGLILISVFTGCETMRSGGCCGRSNVAESLGNRERRTVTENIESGLFWLASSALLSAANDTAQTQEPFPH